MSRRHVDLISPLVRDRRAEQSDKVRVVDALFLQQGIRDRLKLRAMIGQQFRGSVGGRVEEALDFQVDGVRGRFAELASLVQFLAEERMVFPCRNATGPIFSLMPQWQTMRRASDVARFKSSSAPAENSSKTCFSAARPPSIIAICECIRFSP